MARLYIEDLFSIFLLRRLVTLFSLLITIPLAQAEPVVTQRESFPLDESRSHAEFRVRVMWLFEIGGAFGAVTGNVSVDHVHSTAQVDAHIAVDTVKMRNPDHEAWVKSTEFFDAQHYPEIHFVSDPFALDRLDSGGEITGTLEVRGLQHEVRFTLDPSDCPGQAARSCLVKAEGHIRRSDFGMRSRRATLSDKVELGFAIGTKVAQ